MLRIESDQKADALYIHLSAKAVKSTKELTPDIVVDLAEDGSLVGIDIQRFNELAEEVASRGERPTTSTGVLFEVVTA